jgi:hypothetical protein
MPRLHTMPEPMAPGKARGRAPVIDAEGRALLRSAMLRWLEKKFQDEVIFTIFKPGGWLCYHTWNAKHSARGFPDLVAIKETTRGLRLIFAELKTMKGKVSPEQTVWLNLLARLATAVNACTGGAVSIEVYIWRPSDWDEILEVAA